MAENAGLDQAAAQALFCLRLGFLHAEDTREDGRERPGCIRGKRPAADRRFRRAVRTAGKHLHDARGVRVARRRLQPAAEQIAFLYQENVPEDDLRVRPQRGLPGVRRAFHGIMGGRIACFVGYGRTSAYAVLRPVRHPVGIRAHPLRELRQHRPKPSSLHEHRGRSTPIGCFIVMSAGSPSVSYSKRIFPMRPWRWKSRMRLWSSSISLWQPCPSFINPTISRPASVVGQGYVALLNPTGRR